ncbi:succinyldiaminopimelate transaminase [Devriesea agamarum]|uniref:succinyldiaminopimelate transaminase n=1 Tax=Devriesea agamarum TaxID=472569 RepID=UPI00071E0412|nr:succinyldiaminopimelate transaminase [Devriesea agamarum]
MNSLAARLPDFPWDSLAPHRERALAHPGGIVDLSVGTPVDSVPPSLQEALAAAADAHGYPTTIGTVALRDALVRFAIRERQAPSSCSHDHVLPTIGSKELVAHLPFQLGVGPGDVVAFPHIAYPTYDIGARLARADAAPVDIARLAREGDAAFEHPDIASRVRLLWLNSPSNPTGEVLDIHQLRALVAWAKQRNVVIASDECYALLTWDVDEAPSILDPRVHDGDLSGLLCVYSLSKQSNLAGYRAAFTAGDPALIAQLRLIRKQSGMMLPGPIQAAMAVALDDQDTVRQQREIYCERRQILRGALIDAGARIEGSQAGLYLWTTFDEPAMTTVERLAEHGILCAPGTFYGEAGEKFVRIAMTVSLDRVKLAADRLREAYVGPARI